jgi:transporter family-2 protein
MMSAQLLYIAAAIAIGACVSLQPPINVVMARTLGGPLLAASISIAISLVCIVAVWLTWGQGAGDLAQVSALPWWVVVGGLVGVVFVAGGVTVAPTLGVALFFVCVVAGQLLGATLADQFGAFGMPVKPVSPMKLVGLGLVLAGAALVQNSGP